METHGRKIAMSHTTTICSILAASTLVCADGTGESGLGAGIPNDKRVDTKECQNADFGFTKNYPSYRLISPQIYQKLDRLAQTKPIYDAGTATGSMTALWAEVAVYGQAPNGVDESWYTVRFRNEIQPGDDGSISYRMSMASLFRVNYKEHNEVRREIGWYDVQTSRELEVVLADICKDARIDKPRILSPTEQIAPKTIALYRCNDESVFADIARLLKESKLSQDVAEGMALAEICIAPLSRVAHKKGEYLIEMFGEPGRMRVSSVVRNDAVVSSVQVLGYINDTTLWRSMCDRYGTREHHEKVIDETSAPSNRRFAPRQPPEVQPPAKPGSAP